MITRLVLFFTAVLVSVQSYACTLCHSPVAEQVRARLFDSDFFVNIAMVSLPALILFGAIFYAARTPATVGRPL